MNCHSASSFAQATARNERRTTMLRELLTAALMLIEQDARQGGIPWFLRLAERWRYWWEEQSERYQRELAEIEPSNRQGEFIAEVQRYARERWPEYPRAGDWMLLSLSAEEPFNQWSEMQLFKERRLKEATGIYGIVVPHGGKASPENVLRWITWLLPKSEGAAPKTQAHPLNFTLADGDARSAPADSIGGLRRTLGHLSARWFWAWLLRDGLIETRLERTITSGAIAFCLLLLSVLFKAPARPYLEDERLIVPWLLAFIASASAALISLLWAGWRKYRRARRDLWNWMDLLQRSDVGMALDCDRHLIVEGASFGMSLSLSVLLALDAARPAKSGFWRHITGSLRDRARTRVFTGQVRVDGGVGEVEDIHHKLEAARLHGGITSFVMPVQQVDAVATERRGERAASLVGLRNNGKPVTRHCGSASVVSASSGKRLAVLRVDRLTRLLFDFGLIRRYLAGGLFFATALCLTGMAGWACFDIWDLLESSPPPKVLPTSINIRNSGLQANLPLEVASDVPEKFTAAVVSHYWMSTRPQRLIRGGPKMFKLRRASSPQYGAFDGLVEVYRLRRLLWRELPSKRVRSVTLKEITIQQ